MQQDAFKWQKFYWRFGGTQIRLTARRSAILTRFVVVFRFVSTFFQPVSSHSRYCFLPKIYHSQ